MEAPSEVRVCSTPDPETMAVEEMLTALNGVLADMVDALGYVTPYPPHDTYLHGLADGIAAAAAVVRRRIEDL